MVVDSRFILTANKQKAAESILNRTDPLTTGKNPKDSTPRLGTSLLSLKGAPEMAEAPKIDPLQRLLCCDTHGSGGLFCLRMFLGLDSLFVCSTMPVGTPAVAR